MEAPQNRTEALALIPLYVGGDLDRPATAAVERLLEAWPEGRAALASAREARAALLGLGEREERLPDLWPALRTRLAAEGLFEPRAALAARAPRVHERSDGPTSADAFERGRRRSASLRPSAWRGWVPAAAAAAVFGLGLWMGERVANEPVTPVEGGGPVVATVPVAHELRPALPGESLRDQGLELFRGELDEQETAPRVFAPMPGDGSRPAGLLQPRRYR